MSLDNSANIQKHSFVNFQENCDNNFLTLLKNNIYTLDKDNFGHVVIIVKDFIPGQINKHNREIFIKYIVFTIQESLIISKKYNKTTAFTHLYLNNCTKNHFSFSLFKKINKILANEFEDTMENLYIYNNSNMFANIWKIIRNFIDHDTRNRIVLISV